MVKSLVNQYLLLSVSKGKGPDSFFSTEIMAMIVTLGLYELEKNEIIKITTEKQNATIAIKSELTEDLQYLEHLYKAIVDSEKKNLLDLFRILVLDIKGKYYDRLSRDLIEKLKSEGALKEELSKSIFGIEKRQYIANGDIVDETLRKVKSEIFNENSNDVEILILSKILVKTGLIYELYNKNDYKSIKERIKDLEKNIDPNVLYILNYIDELYAFIAAIITSTVN